MSLPNCVRCGKETGEGELYCRECQACQGVQRPKRFLVFSILFSATLLFLTALLLGHGRVDSFDLSLDSILGKPIAMINDEPILRGELKARLKSIQTMLERQYGKDIFGGQKGELLKQNLKKEILESMLVERLISQEARKEGIKISEKRVQEELKRMAEEFYGPGENIQAKLQEDGISREDVENYIRNLLLYQEVKAAKAPVGFDPDNYFSAWVVQAKQKARIVLYDSPQGGEASFSLFGDCCRSGNSPGCSWDQSRPSGPIDPQIESEAKRAALQAF